MIVEKTPITPIIGIYKINISAVCRGGAKLAGGFKWKFYEEETNLIAAQ